MAGKYRSRTYRSWYRLSETGGFPTSIADSRWALPHQGQVWRPPTDVYETDNSIVVKVEVAGMAEDDFTITFAEPNLIIAGARHDPSAKLGYHQMEIPYGEFVTDVYISEAIDVKSIEATYKDGFLLVNLPKASAQNIPIRRK